MKTLSQLPKSPFKLTGYVEIRKEYDSITGHVYRAYWRGTQNRIKTPSGENVPPRMKASSVRFDLLNNPSENGVLLWKDTGRPATLNYTPQKPQELCKCGECYDCLNLPF